MYHNTVHCIVAGMTIGGQIWSQYKNCIVRNSGKRQGCLCRKTDSCVITRRWARQQARAGALGRRRACWGAQGERGVRCRRTLGRRARARGSWAQAQGAGRAAWALGARLGRTG